MTNRPKDGPEIFIPAAKIDLSPASAAGAERAYLDPLPPWPPESANDTAPLGGYAEIARRFRYWSGRLGRAAASGRVMAESLSLPDTEELFELCCWGAAVADLREKEARRHAPFWDAVSFCAALAFAAACALLGFILLFGGARG
ncbi:MAG: hypothetical protein NW200_03880 [Hyphomonadaceae bacterium]|nr:hypothetical protein [Hyphomonadaceae bacterium]